MMQNFSSCSKIVILLQINTVKISNRKISNNSNNIISNKNNITIY